MKNMIQLDTFEDIEKVFYSGDRAAGDESPRAGARDRLVIDGPHLSMESDRFVLSDTLKKIGRSFVLHCIRKVVGSSARINSLSQEDED